MYRGKVYPGVSELPRGNELSRDHVNRPYEDSDKDTVFGEFFTDRPGVDILYYPEERDHKGELIKDGHYELCISQF